MSCTKSPSWNRRVLSKRSFHHQIRSGIFFIKSVSKELFLRKQLYFDFSTGSFPELDRNCVQHCFSWSCTPGFGRYECLSEIGRRAFAVSRASICNVRGKWSQDRMKWSKYTPFQREICFLRLVFPWKLVEVNWLRVATTENRKISKKNEKDVIFDGNSCFPLAFYSLIPKKIITSMVPTEDGEEFVWNI